MSPIARIKLGVSRGRDISRDAKQRAKCVERIEAPVKPKREFIEVGLQMLMTHTVMSASQPGFQVREYKDNRQVFFGNLRGTALGDGKVLAPSVFEVVIPAPVIGNNQKCVA